MAFDEGLAERIREILAHDPSFSEKRMFGGLAFLYEGRMFVGIAGDTMMARVGPAQYQAALARPHVREMDFTGRPMKGYVFIDPPGFAEDADLREWVLHCRSFVASIPAKAPPKKRRSGA